VASDQKTSLIDAEHDEAGTVIENEIPTYRAISGRAVFSVVCGVLSVLCFAHWVFYALSILAIGLGIWAHRTIRRFPDMLTGQRLASAGIACGVIFGASSLTITTVQYLVRSRQAKLFATKFATVLEAGDMSSILWYNTHPETRKDKTAADISRELDSKPMERRRMESSVGPLAQLTKLHERIASSKEQKVRFIELERVGEDEQGGLELQVFATALFEIAGPPSEKFSAEKEYALAVLKARPKGRTYEWWADTVLFPYKPATYKVPEKPVGDSHGEAGHAH
jgi:Domain of unknown function (DUF4190)